MSVLRVSMNVILPDDASSKTIVDSLWRDLKRNRLLFKSIPTTHPVFEETTFIKVYRCFHDEPRNTQPCIEIRTIAGTSITREDTV